MLNKIRIVNAYVLVFTTLFLLQKYTIGFIPRFRELTAFNTFYLQDFIFIVSAALFILLFVRADEPKRFFSIRRIRRL